MSGQSDLTVIKKVAKATDIRLVLVLKLIPMFRFAYYDGTVETRQREVDRIENTARISNWVIYKVWRAWSEELSGLDPAD